MDTFPRSPETKETYREFLLTRGPIRLRQLITIALVATPVLFALDVLYVLAARGGAANLGAIALARLPWGLVPLAVLAVQGLLSLQQLPKVAFWATALFAIGSEWTFYRIGTAGSGYHVVMVFLNVLTGPSVLPVSRSSRFGFYGLLALAHLTFDLFLSTTPLGATLVLDVTLMVGALAVGYLLEALHSGHQRQFHLRRDMLHALREVEASRGKVVETGRTLAGSAQVMSTTISEMSAQAAHVRTAALRIAAASEQMASAAGALFRHSRASGTQAEEAQRYTGEVDTLISGMETSLSAIGQAVGRSALSVQKLEESSERIHGFVETIQEMAAATNMLALNAGIEAARAGDHGRGFAVVAKEVGKLAEESGRSSARIGEVVGGVTRQMSDTLQAVGHIRETTERFTPVLESARTTLRSIREIVLQNQKLMEKSSGEAERQAEQTTHISQGCATLLELVDTYAQMGTDAAATALQLGKMAEELRKQLPDEALTSESRAG
ncbi:methyl-accepting chemotaxis protein [Vitiosangium sp. GDMCC 1.1324]|uniref:methyl-accepting chemotaxis protein n=1 Tax=Vitiosangium sp. (strain GDMCC 1.1324) TaxID=2138576 RepID=UPI0011B40B8D|nr:methyl-accepting chemotaxis protein [Vitiosangium sp. GDMCC 1.1324]